jgi:polyhydroxybutyrate depolymerase
MVLLGATPGGAVLVPGTTIRTLEFGGETRSYRLKVPASYDGAAPVPLVLDIHGFTSNAAQQEALSGLASVADREGFVIAWPEGLNNAWNAGLCCGNADVDDVGFLRALVAAISADGNIDAARVYATGLSNGGAMTHRLACDAADLFAAAAPLAFPIAFRPLSECRPSRAVPVLTFMGLTDRLVPYDGGLFPSAPDTFAYWRDVNGCGEGEPQDVMAKGRSRCETHTQCTNGVRVGLCSITAASFGGAFFDGHILYINADYNLAELVWAFLKDFFRPAVSPPLVAVVSGPATLAVPGRGRLTETLGWTVTLGDGTWAATDGAGGSYSGSALRREGRERQRILGLTGDSEVELLAALGRKTAELAGVTTVGLAAPVHLVAGVGLRGARVKLSGRLLLAGDAADGPLTVRYRFRLRGQVRK